MLAIEHLSFSYGMVQALHDLTMEMPQGKVTCVMGRNGVGKTTLMKNIMGLLKQSSGTVTLGRKWSALAGQSTGQSRHRPGSAGSADIPKADGRGKSKVGLASAAPIGKTHSRGVVRAVSGSQNDVQANGRRSLRRPAAAAGHRPALAGDPKVLLLDEPTEGIQPNIIQQIGHVLRKLVTERNMTIVLVEQYLDFVREFGHNFYIMNRGRVVAEGHHGRAEPAEIVHSAFEC